jgi:formylglycine-generating enzyme required for sulfatase activity
VVLTEPFYLGKYEVTQAQYEALTGKNPSVFKGSDRPVEQVTWNEADAFGKKLTEKRKDKHVYRLPTEAEWEYSCRGGRSSSLPFGIGDGQSFSSVDANFDGDHPYGNAVKHRSLNETCKVGSYKPNALALYDMHGNAWEWCSDRYAPYQNKEVTNPIGPENPKEAPYRVRRGGCFNTLARNCRSARRDWSDPDFQNLDLGFRLARTIPPTGRH